MNLTSTDSDRTIGGRWMFCLVLSFLAGCAAQIPQFSGGSTTPKGRVDGFVGSAATFAFGRERHSSPSSDAIAPLGGGRFGLENLDLGLLGGANFVQLSARREWLHKDGSTRYAWFAGGSPSFSYIADETWQVRGRVHAGFGVDVGGVYEGWAALQIGGGFLSDGGFYFRQNDAAGFSEVGALIGMAVGFRRVHAIAEFEFDWQHFFFAERENVFLLTPSFAIRVRF